MEYWTDFTCRWKSSKAARSAAPAAVRPSVGITGAGILLSIALSEAEREEVVLWEDIEEEQTQEMKDRLLRVDLRIRVVACSTARGAHRLFQTMS